MEIPVTEQIEESFEDIKPLIDSENNTVFVTIEEIENETSSFTKNETVQEISEKCSVQENRRIDNVVQSSIKQECNTKLNMDILKNATSSTKSCASITSQINKSAHRKDSVMNSSKSVDTSYYPNSQTNNFKCTQCGESFNSASLYVVHWETHCTNDVDKTQCGLCGKTFSVKRSLVCHVKAIHGNYNEQCRACNKTFLSIDSFRAHIKAVHPENGQSVAQTSPSEERLVLGETSDRNGETDSFKCTQCGESFNSARSFVLHWELHCTNEVDKTRCGICSKTYISRAKLVYHVKHIHGSDLQRCRICSKVFKSIINVRAHIINVHNVASTNDEGFKCSKCSMVFKNAFAFHQHCEEHDTGIIKPFTCDKCGIAFCLQQHLHIHKCTPKNMLFQCEKCDKVFKQKESLKCHVESFHEHKKKAICHLCAKPFVNTSNLRDHIKMVHVKSTNFLCETCGKAFTHPQKLKEHGNIHLNVKNFNCPVCGNSFRKKCSLQSHMKKHGEKNYECPVCKKRFKLEHTLKEHERIHTGSKPYACDKCGKRFMWFTSRKLHSEKHCGKRREIQ